MSRIERFHNISRPEQDWRGDDPEYDDEDEYDYEDDDDSDIEEEDDDSDLENYSWEEVV